MNEEIKLIITDFDGTLVDTFEANLCLTKKPLHHVDYSYM